jgi:transcriptional regulator with XRE-family HTH domain
VCPLKKSIHTDDQEFFLAVLRKLRTEKNLRQQDVARLLGEPQSFVSKYETGERRLDLLELREVCRVLGVSLIEFVRKWEERIDETE